MICAYKLTNKKGETNVIKENNRLCCNIFIYLDIFYVKFKCKNCYVQ